MSNIIDRIAEARNTIELEHAAADAIDEIKQLRKDVVHWREARRTCIEAGDIMKTEIERLREKEATAEIIFETNKQQRAEIERLRGLLHEVMDGLDDYWVTTPEGISWILRCNDALGDESNPSSR